MKNRKAFITGISSTYLKKNEVDFLKTNKPWGVILFSRNINNFDQAKMLINNGCICVSEGANQNQAGLEHRLTIAEHSQLRAVCC